MNDVANLIDQLDSFIEGQNRHHAFSKYSYGPLKSLVSELRTSHSDQRPLAPIISQLEAYAESQVSPAFRSHSYHALMNYAARLRLSLQSH